MGLAQEIIWIYNVRIMKLLPRIERVRTLHRYNAMLLAVFLVTHLSAHLFAILGPQSHTDALAAIQWVYRYSVVEAVLIAAFAMQIMLGLRLAIFRWADRRSSAWASMQLFSGIYLLLFILNHSISALIARYGLGLETGFAWVSTPLNTPLVQWFFYPYYALAVCSLCVHIGAALHFRGRPRLAKALSFLGVPIAAAYLASFGGWIYPVEPVATYQDIYTF